MCDGVENAMDDLCQAVSDRSETESGTYLVINLLGQLKERKMRSFIVHLHEISKESKESVRDDAVQLTFVKSRHL